MYLLALQFQGHHIETKGCIQVVVGMCLTGKHLSRVHKAKALSDVVVHAIIINVPVAMGVAAQEAYQPALAALEVPHQTKLPALPTIRVVGQQMAEHFAGGTIGILHAHPTPYGMRHVVGEYQDISPFVCTLQYTNQPLQLLACEGVVVLAKSLSPLAVQEDDADVLFGQAHLASGKRPKGTGWYSVVLLLRPNHGCLVYKSIRRGKVPSAGESA